MSELKQANQARFPCLSAGSLQLSQDAIRLRSTIGEKCTLDLAGLENRVQWERSDISELTLYIEYNLVLTACQ